MKKGVDYPGITVVFACHDGAGNFLLSKRSINCRDEHGTWDPGGGGIEVGDTIEETLYKEIMEEYCTEVLVFERLGYREALRMNGTERTHWISFDFKVLVRRATVRNGEPHKADEIGWFTLDALPSPMHSQWPIFFSRYEKQLRSIPPR